MSMTVYETNGEYFVDFLFRSHIDSGPSTRQIPLSLIATSRGSEWSDALHEMAVLHLARRLIVAAVSIVSRAPEWDFLVEREIKQMILDTMTIDYFVVNEIYERLTPAVRSARQSISNGARSQLKAQMRRSMPWCYLCGTDLEFDVDGPRAFSLDHVWPRAYGGDSDPDNVLPACKSCNERKASVPSWALYPVQALVAGYQLDAADIAEMPKEMRFAVQARAATDHARRERTSLKEAFIDLSTSVDVFNLLPQPRL
jgi:5-methylcytosine-specific restriction endonuclease McrA